MACFNYRLCKRASWTPPTQGNFNPGESSHIAQADRIASAWDRPTPQQTNAGGNGGGFGTGMMTGVLSTMGVLAPVAGGLYKKYQQFKPAINAYNNLSDENKKWLEAQFKNSKGGDPNKQIDQLRYAQENPITAGFGMVLNGVKGLFTKKAHTKDINMSYSNKLQQLRKQAGDTPDWVLPTVGGVTGGVGGLVFNRYVLDNKSKKSALIAGLLGAGLGVGASHILSTAGESKQDRESKADTKDRRKIQKILISNGVEPTAENVEAFKASLGSGVLGSAKLTIGALLANSSIGAVKEHLWHGVDGRYASGADVNKAIRNQEAALADKLAKGEKSTTGRGRNKQTTVYDNKMYEADLAKLRDHHAELQQQIHDRNNPFTRSDKAKNLYKKAPNWLQKMFGANDKKAVNRHRAGRMLARTVGGLGRSGLLAAGILGDITRAATRNSRAANEIGIDKSLLSSMQDQYND